MTSRRRRREMARDGWRLIHPDEEQAHEKIAQLGPVMGDQLEAALNDQISLLRVVTGSDIDERSTTWSADSGPPWAMNALSIWVAKGNQLCDHLTWTMGPQPLWLMAWAPETVLCTSCMTRSHAETNGTPEDFTCDGCRARRLILTQAAVTMGNMSLLGGLCDTCVGIQRGYF